MTRLNVLQPLGLLLMRLAFGIIFVSNGYGILFPRPSASVLMPHAGPSQHLLLSHNFVLACAVLSLFGGGLLIVGLFTRITALLLTIEIAFFIWNANGKVEMAIHNYGPWVLAVGCFALATLGAGRISADYALYESGGRPRSGKTKAK